MGTEIRTTEERTMDREEIEVGGTYTCRIGRNTVVVRVTAARPDIGWTVETEAGRLMSIADPRRFVRRIDALLPSERLGVPPTTPDVDVRLAALETTTAPTPPTEAPSAPETHAPDEDATNAAGPATGAPAGQDEATAGEPPAKTSLVGAAILLMQEANAPMRCMDLVKKAAERGLWSPKRGGKTPERTLYAAIEREIEKKGDASRFRKIERGLFALRAG